MNRSTGAGHTADVLRYSISLDKIEKVSTLSTPNSAGLALQSNNRKSIYYFGGIDSPTSVHNFNRETNVTVRLPTTFPTAVYASSGVSINGSHYIFSGRLRNVLVFSEESEAVKIVGDLPFQDDNLTVLSTAAILNGQDSVWLFAGNSPKATNPVLLFNVTTKDVDVQVANTTTLPTLYQVPVSVSDGRNGYIIGAFGNVRESDGSYYPTNGILR
jgi:N-acetylneuraminic acid mutarotase